jgi:rhamnosyl/mannosyltransferase
MKVLHVFKTATPFTQGGLEESIRQICLGTAAAGARCDVLCVGPDRRCRTVAADYARVTGYPASFRVSTCPVPLRMNRALWRAFDAYDIVHLHAPWPFAEMAAWLRPGGRARRVLTYHADIVNRGALARAYRPALQRMLDGCDAVVATSTPYIDTSPVLAGLQRRPHVIPLGIDPASYPAPEPARVAAWRERLRAPLFVFLGVLRYYKGLDVLAEASRRVPGTVAVVGDGPEGARLAARTADRADFVLTGHVPDADKMALLHAARAVVLPSVQRAEAFGISLLEGAMAGRALISTALGTGTDIVNRHGETGLVVPPGDADALAAAMTRLADAPDTAAGFGAAARARFDACYTGAAMGAAYARLYRDLRPAPPDAPATPFGTTTG